MDNGIQQNVALLTHNVYVPFVQATSKRASQKNTIWEVKFFFDNLRLYI